MVLCYGIDCIYWNTLPRSLHLHELITMKIKHRLVTFNAVAAYSVSPMCVWQSRLEMLILEGNRLEELPPRERGPELTAVSDRSTPRSWHAKLQCVMYPRVNLKHPPLPFDGPCLVHLMDHVCSGWQTNGQLYMAGLEVTKRNPPNRPSRVC